MKCHDGRSLLGMHDSHKDRTEQHLTIILNRGAIGLFSVCSAETDKLTLSILVKNLQWIILLVISEGFTSALMTKPRTTINRYSATYCRKSGSSVII